MLTTMFGCTILANLEDPKECMAGQIFRSPYFHLIMGKREPKHLQFNHYPNNTALQFNVIKWNYH